MKYHIWTMGCPMNEADSRHLAARLEQAGYAPCAEVEEADLVILNTCVVRQQAEDKAYSRLEFMRQLKQRRPGLKIALMGCLVGAREGTAAKVRETLAFVDYFLPPSDPSPLLDSLTDEEAALRSEDEAARRMREAVQEGALRMPRSTEDAVTANVPAVLGCSHACTYCIIPYRRGAEHSRPADAILAELRALAADGVREVMLLGQIVDRYGRDLPGGPDLAGLLRRASAVEGLLRVRFMTSHPLYLADEVIDTVAECPALCPHIEIPVQSGSDRVLAAMRRGYTNADYRRRIERIRERLPGAAVHTDLIVGFPGETAEDFEDSVRLVEDLAFDKIHLAKYSPRPQTYAARRLPDDVPPEEKDRRWKILDDLQRDIQAKKNEARVGALVDVLVEGRDERRGRWRGRTPDDRVVYFDGGDDLRGHVARVRIRHAAPYSLVGEHV